MTGSGVGEAPAVASAELSFEAAAAGAGDPACDWGGNSDGLALSRERSRAPSRVAPRLCGLDFCVLSMVLALARIVSDNVRLSDIASPRQAGRIVRLNK